MCYIQHIKHLRLQGFIGDSKEHLSLRIYADADLGGDRPEFKSTSGAFLCLVGTHSFFPLSAKVTKQTAVAHSTPEAEIVSANEAIRRVGIPALDIWEIALERTVPLTLIEDNESTVCIIKSGRNPTMRHLSRTQGINIGWLHDLYKKELFNVMYSRTEAQCADVFTKCFKDLPKWEQAYRMIGMRRPGEPPVMPPTPGPRPPVPEAVAKAKAEAKARAKARKAGGGW